MLQRQVWFSTDELISFVVQVDLIFNNVDELGGKERCFVEGISTHLYPLWGLIKMYLIE